MLLQIGAFHDRKSEAADHSDASESHRLIANAVTVGDGMIAIEPPVL